MKQFSSKKGIAYTVSKTAGPNTPKIVPVVKRGSPCAPCCAPVPSAPILCPKVNKKKGVPNDVPEKKRVRALHAWAVSVLPAS